jgi:hypothetical protein
MSLVRLYCGASLTITEGTKIRPRKKRLRIEEVEVRSEEGHVRFEVFTAVTMRNGVRWDVTPCSSCKNRRFGGT